MKWNDITKTPLPEPIPEWYRLTHDAQTEGHILLFGYDKINFSPCYSFDVDYNIKDSLVDGCFGNLKITHWMSVGRPYADNTEEGI